MNDFFHLKYFASKIFLEPSQCLLTLLSTAYGVFSLLLLLAFTQSLEKLSQQDLLHDGAANSLWIQAGYLSQNTNGSGMNTQLELNETDFRQIKNLAGIDDASPVYFQILPVKTAFQQLNNVNVFGVNRHFFKIKPYPLLAGGRYFHQPDQTGKRAIIGKDLALTLFNQANPLGKTLLIAGHAFVIIGVVDANASNSDEANFSIWLPESCFKILFSPHPIQGILLKIPSHSDRGLLKRQLLMGFALSHQLPLYESLLQIEDSTQSLQQQNHFHWILNTVFFLIGSILLLLSCLGLAGLISSLLMDDATEIGLKLALGARYHHIQAGYLLLAAAISGAAILIAVFSAYLFSALLNAMHIYLLAFQGDLQLKINVELIVLSGGLCLFMSICAAYWPLRHLKYVSPVNLLKQI